MPIKICEIELTKGLHPICIEDGYSDVRILVRHRGRPIGWIELPARKPVVSTERLRNAILDHLGDRLVPVVFQQQNGAAKPSTNSIPISVIVCTRDRAEQLRTCLDALCSCPYPNREIIVVDNASSTKETAVVAQQFPVRYLREPRPGLDFARNRGIVAASNEVIAFIDDDARPDRDWLNAIAKSFSEPEIKAVTGPVLPAELETAAQMEFEFNYGGMSHGFERRVIRRDEMSIWQLLWASSFGVGTNMAFRREVFASTGFFDLALDVGTPSGGGGDIEFLHRLVAKGHTLLYEPKVLVWHTHRRDFDSFRRQLFNNGTGFGCYLLTCLRNKTVSRRAVLRFTIKNWGWSWLVKRLLRRGKLPRRYVSEELKGALASPLLYLKSQLRAREIIAPNTATIRDDGKSLRSLQFRMRLQPVMIQKPESNEGR